MIPKTLKTLINHSLNENYNLQCVNTYTLSNEDVKFINIDKLFTPKNNHISVIGGCTNPSYDENIYLSGSNVTINEQLDALIKQNVMEFNLTEKQYKIFVNNINNSSINSHYLNTLPLFLLKEQKTNKNNGKLVIDYEYGVEYADLNILNSIPNAIETKYGELSTVNGYPSKITNNCYAMVYNNENIKPYKKLTKINNYVCCLLVYGTELHSMVSTNIISIGGVDNNQRIYLYGTNVLFLIEYIPSNDGGDDDGGDYDDMTCVITAVKLDYYDLNTADVQNPSDFVTYTHTHIIKALASKKYFLVDELPFYDEKDVNISVFSPNNDYLSLIGNTDDKMVYPLNKSPRLKERKELSNFAEINKNHTFNNDFYSFSSNLINQSSLYLLELLKGKDKYVKLFFTTAEGLTFTVDHTNSDVEIFNKDHLIYLKNVVIPADLVKSKGLNGKTITKIQCQMYYNKSYSSKVFYYPVKEIKNLNIPIKSNGITFSYKL